MRGRLLRGKRFDRAVNVDRNRAAVRADVVAEEELAFQPALDMLFAADLVQLGIDGLKVVFARSMTLQPFAGVFG